MASIGTAGKVLFDYVKDPRTRFYWYHNPKRINELNNEHGGEKTHVTESSVTIGIKNGLELVIHKHLHAFFETTLDEMRLKRANQFSAFALRISDNGILSHFRVAASMREFGADIDFDRQRDHAGHTLYNYILGWYIFDYCKGFRDQFEAYLIANRLKLTGENFDPSGLSGEETKFYEDKGKKYGSIKKKDFRLANEFGDVWSIASLLHDIGYIFEGTIAPSSLEVENVRVSRGAKLIHDFFSHGFWRKSSLDFSAAQTVAKVLNVSFPDFRSTNSLSSLSDHLCDIGACENIRKDLKRQKGFDKTPTREITEDYGLNRSAFSLWKTYYDLYGKENMKKILDVVLDQYQGAMGRGSNQGYRNLNHGVCGGLMVLKSLSFFYDFVYGFRELGEEKDMDDDALKRCLPDEEEAVLEKHKAAPDADGWINYWIRHKLLIDKGTLNTYDEISMAGFEKAKSFIRDEYLPGSIVVRKKLKNVRREPSPVKSGHDADYWFNGVLWATISVAIHDIVQEKYYEKICIEKYGEVKKIDSSEDPLAFLGVLVDVLQEWDRYTVSGESAFCDKELLQSTETYIENTDGEIVFYYPRRNEEDLHGKIIKTLSQCLVLEKADDKDCIIFKHPKIRICKINEIIKIIDKPLPDGRVNQNYGPYNLKAKGGSGHYLWDARDLPKGLNINNKTGELSGAPSERGSPTVTIMIKDLDYPELVCSKECVIRVIDVSP